MSFTYTTDIPDGPNNPSNDQPDMKINTNSIDSIIAVDHVGFNTPKGGFHKQVKFTANQAAPGFGTGVGDIYANTASGNSWPFWENALGSFQLAGNQTASSNGRVVIPGGIILQWGTGGLGSSSSQQNFVFPTAFTNNCFNIQATATYSGGVPGGAASVAIRPSTVTTTGFSFLYQTNASNYTNFYWFAIGN